MLEKHIQVRTTWAARETKRTHLRWQERLSEHDSSWARNPRNTQNRRKPPLHNPQNSFLGPRTLDDGAISQEHRDLNRGDDEQTGGQHPEFRASSGSAREELVHGFDHGVAQGG